MGYAKNRTMEIEEQGYNCTIENNICHYCVDDYALVDFIKTNGKRRKCSYCGKVAYSVDFESFCDIVVRNIKKVYSTAIDDLYYDKEDPTGFFGGTEFNCQDTYDMINSLGCFDDKVCDDLIKCISDELWCEEPYKVSDSSDTTAWDNFCHKAKNDDKSLFDIQIINDNFVGYKYDFFSNICKMIDVLKLVKLIKKKTNIYRIRPDIEKHNEWRGKDLGSPPSRYAKNNRMSKDKESVFYGSFEIDTCSAEVSNYTNEVLHLGIFNSTRDLLLLDLSRIDAISIFDEEKNEYFYSQQFLQKFIKDISKPICESDRENDYKPTQKLTKYFRDNVLSNGKRIDGIIYNSSLKKGEKNVIIFADNNMCGDKGDKNKLLNLICNKIL